MFAALISLRLNNEPSLNIYISSMRAEREHIAPARYSLASTACSVANTYLVIYHWNFLYDIHHTWRTWI